MVFMVENTTSNSGNGGVPLMSPQIVRAVLADFGGNRAAMADYVGIPLGVLNRAVNGEMLDPDNHTRLWKAARKRLGLLKLNNLLNGRSRPAAVTPTTTDAPPTAPQKQCTKCGQSFAATIENFAHHSKNKDGLFPHCRGCHGDMMRTAQRASAAARTANAAAKKAALATGSVTPAPPRDDDFVTIPALVAPAGVSPALVSLTGTTWEGGVLGLKAMRKPATPAATPAADTLSARLLQLAADAESLEAQLDAAGGASAATGTKLEEEVARLQTQVQRLGKENEMWRERVATAVAYQSENADLMARLAALTKVNADLWQKVDAAQQRGAVLGAYATIIAAAATPPQTEGLTVTP